MDSLYGKWYEDFKESTGLFEDDELFESLDTLLHSSKNTFAMNKKLMAKAIDVSWVEAIENGLIHLDNVLRNPRRTIEDVEEIVPIALSRKITVESVKHLAQHTDLIQSYDKKTGKITPSKVLNVHKEESLMTYENKFVNTLVDRLYIFISTRYEKLAQVARDEEVFSLGYDTTVDDGAGGKLKIEVKLESTSSLDSYNKSGYTVWQRVEKLKKAIEGYKGSELCQKLGNTYVRPPIMRTNAIMKNVDLKACLTLWQYIESYEKVGYEINVEDTALKPQENYIEDFYKLVILNLLLFRSYTDDKGKAKGLTELKTQKFKKTAPKVVKHFSGELSGDYGIIAEGVAGYVATEGDFKIRKNLPQDIRQVFDEVNTVIDIEREFIAQKEAERQKAEQLRLEEEKRQEEQRRIEEARQEELERIRKRKEEEERRLQEMLEQKRREQEEEERRLAAEEAERQARLEDMRRREEEERKRREEEERAAAERERISLNKSKMRSELGEAEGLDSDEINNEPTEEELEKEAYEQVTEEEIEQAKAAIEEMAEEEQEAEFEDPRAVAARLKMEQQRKEKERREAERAARLKADREYFQNKPFRTIYKEYSKNPIYAIPRLIRHLLVILFGIIPKDTDNPDYKRMLAEKEEKKRQKQEELEKRNAMEVYYKKYAKTFKYRLLRSIDDYKFKKRKKAQMKGKPKPVYNPPKRTPEEQQAINTEMKRLYKEYHVSAIEKVRRHIEEQRRAFDDSHRNKRKEQEQALLHKIQNGESTEHSSPDNEDSTVRRIANVITTVILIAAVIFTAYVMICAARNKVVDVFGKSILRVVTGSMEPSIHVDEYIVVEKTDPSTLKQGDIISFYSEQTDIYGLLVTHRIAKVCEDGTFITKGDANDISDRVAVKPDKIVGKYTGKARFFIWVNSFASPRKILMICVIIPVAAIFILELRSLAKISKEVSENKKISAEEHKQELMRAAIEKEKQRLAEIGYQAEEVKSAASEPPEDNSSDTGEDGGEIG
ncbi:signal peptidase I [Ruminococcus sp.]|uniref:signal peptidase I n=1 Tax=Ruminococcus sp. TaxID=41978 RepID=UPI0025EE8F39|nr:signal peptidase I [Ruminococcus sp.]